MCDMKNNFLSNIIPKHLHWSATGISISSSQGIMLLVSILAEVYTLRFLSGESQSLLCGPHVYFELLLKLPFFDE